MSIKFARIVKRKKTIKDLFEDLVIELFKLGIVLFILFILNIIAMIE